jgi:type I restriction enzyme, S subunit
MSESPTDWSTIRLGEVAKVHHGYAFKSKFFSDDPTSRSLFTRKNFRIGGGFRPDGRRFYEGPVPERFVLSPGDIMVVLTDLSKNGDLLGYPARVPRDDFTYLHNQRVGRVEVTAPETLDPGYLYYLFCSPLYRHHVLATATQTTVRDTAPSRLEAFSFRLPSIEEQRRIAWVLGSLDAKIGHDERLTALLAEQGRLSFERCKSTWGGDATLAEIARLKREVATPEDKDVLPYIGLDNMIKGSSVLSAWLPPDDAPAGQSLLFSTGDILFGKLRPYFKKVGPALFDGRCSTEILVVEPATDDLWGPVLGYLTSDHFIAHCVAVSKGTKMPRSEWVDASRFPVAVPSGEQGRAFSEAMRRIYELVGALASESRRLAAARDILVPSVVSGETRIAESVETPFDLAEIAQEYDAGAVG